MKPEEMERQESTKQIFNLIQDEVKVYRGLAWRDLDEKRILRKIRTAIDKFLTRLDEVKQPEVEPVVPLTKETTPTLEMNSETLIEEISFDPELGNNAEPIIEKALFDDSGLYDDEDEDEEDD